MRGIIATAALLIATASAASPSLRGQEMTQLDDMEVNASVLRARTEADFEKRRRQLLEAGAADAAAVQNKQLYRASFSTPIDSRSTMVVRGKCIQWVQKQEQFKSLVPPGLEAERAREPKIFESSKMEKFKDFDFKKLCSKGSRERGAATGDCAEMFSAVRGLGTAALGKARFCELTESLPCAVPTMDDVSIRIVTPTQPFGDPDADFKVKSVVFEDCSIKIDFESPGNRPSVWSTVEITALFPSPGIPASSAATDGGLGSESIRDVAARGGV